MHIHIIIIVVQRKEIMRSLPLKMDLHQSTSFLNLSYQNILVAGMTINRFLVITTSALHCAHHLIIAQLLVGNGR